MQFQGIENPENLLGFEVWFYRDTRGVFGKGYLGKVIWENATRSISSIA